MADSSPIGRNMMLAGIFLGLGAAAAGFYVSSSYEKPEVDTSVRRECNVTAMAEEVKADYEATIRSCVLVDVAPKDAYIARKKMPGADGKMVDTPEGKVPRFAPLFLPPKLWVSSKPAEGVDKGLVIDLMAPGNSSNLHGNVPNEKFFYYGLDDVICEPNALELDSDSDGFSNGEEFEVGTDPSDAKDFPPFVVGDTAKMVYVKNPSEKKYTIELNAISDFSAPGGASLYINIYAGEIRKGAAPAVLVRHKDKKEGDSFGISEDSKGASAKDRFKIVSATKTAEGECIQIEDSYARVPANKTFVVYKGKDKAHVVSDVSVSFRVTAGPEKGKELDHIQLGESFAVPGFKDTTATLAAASKEGVKVMIGDKEIAVSRDSSAQKPKK